MEPTTVCREKINLALALPVPAVVPLPAMPPSAGAGIRAKVNAVASAIAVVDAAQAIRPARFDLVVGDDGGGWTKSRSLIIVSPQKAKSMLQTSAHALLARRHSDDCGS
jgi:hypothetical protein